MSYNSLRDRHNSSIGGAPIGFYKYGPDEYRSKVPAPNGERWVIKHRYKTGYQAHHEWRVTAPDGSLFDRFTHGHYYLTLSDAVQAINKSVAYGVITMLLNLQARLQEQGIEHKKREHIIELRANREWLVRQVLGNAPKFQSIEDTASQIVDQLFGKAAL